MLQMNVFFLMFSTSLKLYCTTFRIITRTTYSTALKEDSLDRKHFYIHMLTDLQLKRLTVYLMLPGLLSVSVLFQASEWDFAEKRLRKVDKMCRKGRSGADKNDQLCPCHTFTIKGTCSSLWLSTHIIPFILLWSKPRCCFSQKSHQTQGMKEGACHQFSRF